MNTTVFTVSEINERIKQLLNSDRLLADIYVRGELSNYKIYPSGHHYFSLKDETGVLKAIMYSSDSSRLAFRPESGMKVVIRGRIAVYPRDGVYQLYASEIIADGVGALHVAYEQLKNKLEGLGYFDPQHKKPLPRYPQRIALVTSPAGAAVRDMLRILKKRWSYASVVVVPTRVQGEEAPGEISAAIDYVNAHIPCDLIITGRGGGSIEDLWGFNSELVADAIFRSTIPVVSAVGHEPDFTIADFVADLRAATPSNAAELSTPDAETLARQFGNLEARLRNMTLRHVSAARQRYNYLAARPVLRSPEGTIREQRQRVVMAEIAIASAAERFLTSRRNRLSRTSAALDALSPLKVLSRGYAIATRGGVAVRSVKTVSEGDLLELRLTDGIINVSVGGGEPNGQTHKKPQEKSNDTQQMEQLEIV